MDAPAPYIHWGFILISLPNFVLICVMVAAVRSGAGRTLPVAPAEGTP